MVRGKWTFASDGISVNERGQLCNGQHRLTAVVQSGVTVPLELKWNVPSDVMGGYDIGLTRPAWVNAGLPAAARADGDMDISIVRKERARIQEVVTSIRLGFGTVGKLDADEYVALATKHEKALSWFLSVPSQARIIAPVAGAIVYAYPVQPRAVHRFAQSYIDGEGGVKGIPWFQLREQIPLKGKGRAKNMSQAEIFRRSCHALVKTIEEKKLFVLRDEEAHRVLERLREQMKAKK